MHFSQKQSHYFLNAPCICTQYTRIRSRTRLHSTVTSRHLSASLSLTQFMWLGCKLQGEDKIFCFCFGVCGRLTTCITVTTSLVFEMYTKMHYTYITTYFYKLNQDRVFCIVCQEYTGRIYSTCMFSCTRMSCALQLSKLAQQRLETKS